MTLSVRMVGFVQGRFGAEAAAASFASSVRGWILSILVPHSLKNQKGSLRWTLGNSRPTAEKVNRESCPLHRRAGGGTLARLNEMAAERGIPVIDQGDFIDHQGSELHDAR